MSDCELHKWRPSVRGSVRCGRCDKEKPTLQVPRSGRKKIIREARNAGADDIAIETLHRFLFVSGTSRSL